MSQKRSIAGLAGVLFDCTVLCMFVALAFVLLVNGCGCASVRAQICQGNSCTIGQAAPRLVTVPAAKPPAAVVRISVDDGNGETSWGSGTLIGKNEQSALVITNEHVIRDRRGAVRVFFPDGSVFQAKVWSVNADWDLALLQIQTPPARPILLAPLAPRPGEPLWIGGYGHGPFRAAAGRCTKYLAPKVGLPSDLVEVNVPARQGDSGGPIINARGELAGVLWGSGGAFTNGACCTRVEKFLVESNVNLRDTPQVTPAPPASSLTSNPPASSPPASPDLSAYVQRTELEPIQQQVSQAHQAAASNTANLKEVIERQTNTVAAIGVVAEQVAQLDQRCPCRTGGATGPVTADPTVAAGEAGSGWLAMLLRWCGPIALGALGITGGWKLLAIKFGYGLAKRVIKKKRAAPEQAPPQVAPAATPPPASPAAGGPFVPEMPITPAGPRVITTQAPPPPQRTIETVRFVGYEDDKFAQAFAWAAAEFGRKYPGSIPMITGLQSLIHQHLGAH